MTCAAWHRLADSGEALLREGSAERLQALDHLASCETCRSKAYLLEPTWALADGVAEEFSDAEVACLVDRIEAGRRLAGAGPSTHRASGFGERGRGAAVRGSGRGAAWAAAAALVLLAGVAWLGQSQLAPGPGALQPAQAAGQGPRVMAAPSGTLADIAGEAALPPSLELLPPSRGRIYDLAQSDFVFVLFVNEDLDL